MNSWSLQLLLPAAALVSAIVFASCASSPNGDVSKRDMNPVVQGLPMTSFSEPSDLKLSAETGRVERVRHASRTVSRSFEGGRLRDQEESSVEFEVETGIRALPDGNIEQIVKTVSKNGNIDLRSLAFPEFGETIDLRVTRQGKVLHAGPYASESVFFVPPVSLPEGHVSPGETWSLVAEWKSFEDGTPFQLEMVSILRGYVACGSDQCADIELSGEVKIPFEMRRLIGFDSEWRGRMLFARQAGSVVWARIDSLETMQSENVRRQVHSCLESVLMEPKEIHPTSIAGPTCEDGRMPQAFRAP